MTKSIKRGSKVTRAKRERAMDRPELSQPGRQPIPDENLALAMAAAAGFVGKASAVFATLVRGGILCVVQTNLADAWRKENPITPRVRYWLEPGGAEVPEDVALTVIRSDHVVPAGDGLFARSDLGLSSQTFRARPA